jgi:hypothetical protein
LGGIIANETRENSDAIGGIGHIWVLY